MIIVSSMSTHTYIKRKSVLDIASHKNKKESLVCLTAYTAPMASLLDPHCDLLLVGDSLAMVLYGMDSTVPVDLDTMIRHGQAVMRTSTQACVVVDMPFGSFQETKEQAFRNCARMMKETGCTAIKLEGGVEMAETIEFLSSRGIPVMAHVGLQPQSVNTLGGYKARGKEDLEARRIKDDAVAVSKAGAFSVVLEGIAEPLARDITNAISIPTIGIGASAACDGQVLVTDDMLGLTRGPKPKFVKQYATLADNIEEVVKQYANEVKTRQFPSDQYIYYKEKKAS